MNGVSFRFSSGQFHQMGNASSQLVCKFLEEDFGSEVCQFPTHATLGGKVQATVSVVCSFVYAKSNSSTFVATP